MSIPPHADTDSKEGKVPEKAIAAVLVESVPLPERTPTVKGSKPLVHTCRVWYGAKSGNLDYHMLTCFCCAFPLSSILKYCCEFLAQSRCQEGRQSSPIQKDHL
jgi:hypothetical protein